MTKISRRSPSYLFEAELSKLDLLEWHHSLMLTYTDDGHPDQPSVFVVRGEDIQTLYDLLAPVCSKSDEG